MGVLKNCSLAAKKAFAGSLRLYVMVKLQIIQSAHIVIPKGIKYDPVFTMIVILCVFSN